MTVRTATTTPTPSPSSRWLATVDGMPALEGAAGTAERLLLHVHYGIDWREGWVGRYRERYWSDVLPDRCLVATYRSGTLRRWWADLAGELDSTPRSSAARRELEGLLREPDRPVLEILRHDVDALILRVRITSEAVRAQRTNSAGATP